MIEPKSAELLIKEAYNYNNEQDDMPESCQTEEPDECIPVTATDDLGQKMIRAINEIASNDISVKNALRILAAHRHGADTEHSIAGITGIDSWTCKTVLDILHKHGLLNINLNID